MQTAPFELGARARAAPADNNGLFSTTGFQFNSTHFFPFRFRGVRSLDAAKKPHTAPRLRQWPKGWYMVWVGYQMEKFSAAPPARLGISSIGTFSAHSEISK